MNNMMNFDESLSELMISKNITPEKLAEDIKVSLATVYNWKNKIQEPNLNNLLALANYFKCTLEYLIGRSESEIEILSSSCPPFAKRLRQVMKEKGVSTYKLRTKYKFNGGHFQKWDAGAAPLLSTLLELSQILDCSLDYLVGREN